MDASRTASSVGWQPSPINSSLSTTPSRLESRQAGATAAASSAAAGLAASSQSVSHPSPGHEPACSITARQWDTVAVWSWDVQAKTCAICKGSLADQCISCQAQGPQSSTGAATTTGGGAGLRGPSSTPAVGSGVGAHASEPVVGTPTTSAATAAARRTAPAPTPTTAVAKHSTPATLGDLNDKCCIAWGSCGHVFHYHCVSRWLQMRSMCPVCGRQWQLHKITSNE